MTTRRGFLGSILALAAAPAIVRASSLMPVRVFDAEWVDTIGTGVLTRGNTLLTPAMITREALRILENQLVFTRAFE